LRSAGEAAGFGGEEMADRESEWAAGLGEGLGEVETGNRGGGGGGGSVNERRSKGEVRWQRIEGAVRRWERRGSGDGVVERLFL